MKTIFVCNKDLEYALEKRFPLRDYQVIFNSVKPVSFIRQKFYTQNSSVPLQILSIGRLEKQKAFDILFYALSKIHSFDWELHLVGDGPLRHELTHLTSKLGIDSKVFFMDTNKI